MTYKGNFTLARDRVRFALGDVDTANPLLTDAQIAGAITYKGSEAAALLYLANGLLAQFAHQPTRVVADGTTFDYSDRITTWRGIVAEVSSTSTGGLRIRRLARPQLINGGSEYTS